MMIWGNFFIILITVGLYGFVHSLLAAHSVKSNITKRYPQFYKYLYRLLYNLIALITLLPVLYLMWKLKSAPLYTIPAPWVFITLTIQLISALLIITVVRKTGAMEFLGLTQAVNEASQDRQLKIDGAYAIIRHPLYTLGLIVLWLIPIVNTNILAFMLGLTIYTFIGAWLEEKKLMRDYPQYAAYREHVPMFLPGLK